MQLRLLKLALVVLREAGRERPADALVRDTAQRERLAPEDRADLARAVFAYYRWRGWVGEGGIEEVQSALELDARFQTDPRSFSDDELRAKAAPAWCEEVMKSSPAWARALQMPPRLWLRARSGQRERMMSELRPNVPSKALPNALEYQGSEDLFRSPLFHEGAFEIQDISSQAVSVMCAPQPNETWWDACAGEGGKTMHLSDLMQNKGLIWATDRADWRLRLLKRRAGRAGVFNYRAAPWRDLGKLPTKTKFDGILVDAPCSGIGTWQRNPHARWTTVRQDVEELAAVQTKLLEAVAGSLKPGGRLVYAVCTLAKPETRDVAAAFSRAHPEFQPFPLKNPWTGNSGPERWLWPQDTLGNGMFAAAWQFVG